MRVFPSALGSLFACPAEWWVLLHAPSNAVLALGLEAVS